MTQEFSSAPKYLSIMQNLQAYMYMRREVEKNMSQVYYNKE